jgi:RimJ/RimL family protein N-acetyltransferase
MNRPVGQIRFDLGGSAATVSVSVDTACRGRGFGTVLIRLGVERLVESTAVKLLHAYTRPDNLPSIRAFEKAGFSQVGHETYRGQDAVHLRRELKP